MTKTYYKSHDEWHTLRDALIKQGRIGGSMVGTAAGLDPWKSPYTLWAELTGRKPVEDLSGKEAIRLGHDLEDYVAKRFCDLSGKSVHRENCIMTNDAFPHLFASIDRKVSNEEAGLECKTANAYRDGAFAAGSFPDGYFRQVKTYLAVTGLTRWYLAVLVMGIDFRVFMITTDADDLDHPPSWCAGLRYVNAFELAECEEDAAAFLRYVETNTPPPCVGTDDERETINALNGHQSCGTVALAGDVDALIQQRAVLKEKGDADKVELKRLENAIIAALAGAEQGNSAKFKVTYKYSDTRRLDKDAVAAVLGGTIPDACFKVTNGPTLRITTTKKNYK